MDHSGEKRGKDQEQPQPLPGRKVRSCHNRRCKFVSIKFRKKFICIKIFPFEKRHIF